MENEPSKSDRPPVPAKRRRLRMLAIALVIVAVFLPQIVASTPLRNWVINRFVTDPRLHASATGASFGWFSALRMEGFEIADEDKSFRLTIEDVQAGQSWPGLWRMAPELGQITLDRPHLDLLVTPGAEGLASETNPNQLGSTLSVHIRDGGLTIRIPQRTDPVVDLQGLQIEARIESLDEYPDDGRFLTVEPSHIMQRHPLTPELTRDGLQLVAPFLARAVEVDGSLSIELLACRVPLDIDDLERRRELLELEGIVHLHRADAELKNPLLQAILRVVAIVLKRDAPQHIRVADDSQVHFKVHEGRVYHEGLAFVLPDVAADMQIRTSGSVGLDESLDLMVDVQVPSNLPLMPKLAGRVIQLQVTGTIDEPKFALPGADGEGAAGLLASLLNRIKPSDPAAAEGDATNADEAAGAEPPLDTAALAESVVDLLGRLAERRREAQESGEPAPTPLLDRLRERREQRRSQR